mgnify:CR=1 FL=1
MIRCLFPMIWATFWVVAMASSTHAESFEKAQADLDQKLQSSLSELAAKRKQIAKEKIPCWGC